jgi:hypothetical protein
LAVRSGVRRRPARRRSRPRSTDRATRSRRAALTNTERGSWCAERSSWGRLTSSTRQRSRHIGMVKSHTGGDECSATRTMHCSVVSVQAASWATSCASTGYRAAVQRAAPGGQRCQPCAAAGPRSCPTQSTPTCVTAGSNPDHSAVGTARRCSRQTWTWITQRSTRPDVVHGKAGPGSRSSMLLTVETYRPPRLSPGTTSRAMPCLSPIGLSSLR